MKLICLRFFADWDRNFLRFEFSSVTNGIKIHIAFHTVKDCRGNV